LLDLLRRDRQNRKDLNHDLSDYIHHFLCRRHLSIVFKSSEKILYAFEDIDEIVLACPNVLDCLGIENVDFASSKGQRRLRTERRTPTPAKITFAGENTYQNMIKMHISVESLF
jgi:hypothetical protein